MRRNFVRYAATVPDTGTRAADGPTAQMAERGSRLPNRWTDDHVEEESSVVWSLWIDLGGEG
jgi:hypothetical protein